jgi:hypothetical protein
VKNLLQVFSSRHYDRFNRFPKLVLPHWTIELDTPTSFTTYGTALALYVFCTSHNTLKVVNNENLGVSGKWRMFGTDFGLFVVQHAVSL